MTQKNLNLDGVQLAHIYSLAVAYPNNVPVYVAEKGTMLESECTDDSFGRFFVKRLRASAFTGPAPDDVYHEAMQIASMAGAPELGQQLANDFMKDRTDMMLLARYIEDLIEVIPALIQGNANSYQCTSLYSAMGFVWQSASSLMLPGLLQKLQKMAFELNEWYVNSLMDAVRIDYLDSIWPRTAEFLEEIVEKLETASAERNGVALTLYSTVILGTVEKFAPLLGLTEDEIHSMHSGLNINPLLEWLQENDWID